MHKTPFAIAAVLLVSFALADFTGDKPTHPQAVGRGRAAGTPVDAMAVDVMNFPTDEEGALASSLVVRNSVVDLLDSDFFLDEPGEQWLSSVVGTANATSLALHVTTGVGGSVNCVVQWRLTETDSFLIETENGFPRFTKVELTIGSSETRRTGRVEVFGLEGRVRCNSDDAVLSDVKLWLRRE